MDVTANWTQNYGYDRFGNRETVTVNPNSVTAGNQPVPVDGMSYTTNKSNNRINLPDYIYDLAGNLIRGQSPDGVWQKYEYDAAGRLIYVKRDSDSWVQQANGYGSSRQRVFSFDYGTVDLTWYVWGGSEMV